MRTKGTRLRSLFSICMAVALIVTMMPMSIFASERYGTDEAEWVYGTGAVGQQIHSGCKWMKIDGDYYYDLYHGEIADDKSPYGDSSFIVNALKATPGDSKLYNSKTAENKTSILSQWAYFANDIFKQKVGLINWDGKGGWSSTIDDMLTNGKIAGRYQTEPLAVAMSNAEGRDLYGEEEQVYVGTSGLKMATSFSEARKDIAKWVVDKSGSNGTYSVGYVHDTMTAGDANSFYSSRCISSDKVFSFLQDEDPENPEPIAYAAYTCSVRNNVAGGNDDGKGFNGTFILGFYDFVIEPIDTKSIPVISAADGYDTIQSAAGAAGVSYKAGEETEPQISYFNNNSPESNNVSLNFSESISTTEENSFTQSESVMHSAGFSLEFSEKWESPGLEDLAPTFSFTMTENVHTDASDTKTESTTRSTSKSVSSSKSITNSVNLPAYTAARIATSKSFSEMSVDYKCPVVLKYKVYMGYTGLGLKLQSAWDLAANLEYKFGSKKALGGTDAISNLEKRTFNKNVTGYEKQYSESTGLRYKENDGRLKEYTFDDLKINWTTLLQNDKTYSVYDWLTNKFVMSYTGANYSYEETVYNSKLDSIVPIYPLDGITLEEYTQFGDAQITDDGSIKIINKENFKNAYELHDFKMNKGDIFYPRSLTLSPYNQYMCGYYGFKAAFGKWRKVVKDDAGKWVQDRTTSTDNVAKIVTDEESGYQRIDAGNESGTVYFQYFIDENIYKAMNQKEFTTNADIDRPVIKINVTDEAFKGKIKFREDNFKAVSGKKTYNLNDELDPAVYDEDGNLVLRAVKWELSPATKKKADKGFITLEGSSGDVKFSKNGTYNIIAKVGSATAEYKVTVTKSKMKLDVTKETVDVGGQFELVASDSIDDDLTASDFTWTSSNNDVAKVEVVESESEDEPAVAVVTGLKAGTATIKATNEAGNSASCKVNVVNPVVVLRGDLTMDGYVDLSWNDADTADGYEIYGATNSGEWEYIDDVDDENYEITDIAGESLIENQYKFRLRPYTYDTDGVNKVYLSYSPTIYVRVAGLSTYNNAKSVKIKSGNIKLKKKASKKLRATIKIVGGKKQPSAAVSKVRFISNNPSVAKVSSSGKVTAKAKGECNIYAIARNGASSKIKVTVK